MLININIINMGEKSKKAIKENEEKTIVIGEVIESFVKEEPRELSSEEEIEKFELKNNSKEQYYLSEEERKSKEAQEKEEEEKLEWQKKELLVSLQERIPAIEKRIYGQTKNKKEGLKLNISEEKNIGRVQIKSKEKEQGNKEEKNKGFERE